ncbi:TPA: methionyl-tRNA formyltransferase [Candidatus Avigastranaerophilus faecigallinarum]|nr:methionyl-tRNA formyltransferase [Candidatus Avigastranaerophilus faecigallinarum]
MTEKKYKKRILFIGMPDMALVCLSKLAAKGINIVGVVPPAKDDPTNKIMIDTAQNLGFDIIDYNISLSDKGFLQRIKNLNADLGVVASFNKRLPKELLQLTKDGFINLHPSKLPDYRGANPYSHVIINGEEESAITLHFMDENFDTGDIISQYRFNLDLNETMGTLFYRTNQMCASMLYEALDYYETHDFPRKPQPKDGEYKKAEALSFEKKNIFIDWNKSAEEIERFIRGLNPYIGAITCYNGTILRINSAYVIEKNHNFTPGTICDTKNSLKVACGEDILEIDSIQYGAFFISSGRDFVERLNPKKGEILYSE